MTPPGFERRDAAGVSWLVRSDVSHWLVPVLPGAVRGWNGAAARPLSGGRGGTVLLSVGEQEVVARPYLRGGLPARLLRDTYWGWRARPLRELALIEELRRRGAPVVEVYAAGVCWLGWGWYRGWLVTRYVRGARTLWEWAHTPSGTPAERDAVLRAVGQAILRLHAAGGHHPDLNLNNILVATGGDGGPSVLLIDFDRAALSTRRHAPEDLARLRRSARKLDPAGEWLTPADLDRIERESGL